MRWMNRYESQYDSQIPVDSPPNGNYPQSFIHQSGQIVVAAKYCCAVQKWPSVDFARPCGNDANMVDQHTVCCLTSYTAAGGFVLTVAASGEAVHPLAAGGLAANDYVAWNNGTYGGIYKINTIGGTGPWTLHLTTDEPLEDLPGGFDMSFGWGNNLDGTVGRLRFHGASACSGSDSSSKQTGVHLEWTFNQRAQAATYPSPPTWYAGTAGCTGCTVTQFNYSASTCRAMVGIVPFYSGSAVEVWPGSSAPFQMTDGLEFDATFGAHWQSAIALTMEDPFWQRPFKPDCDDSSFAWTEDDGSGAEDVLIDPMIYYFPHRPLVEALSVIPAGKSLPSGVTLFYDPAHNVIAPPYYPNGLPCNIDTGDFTSIETDWGFTLRACAAVSFSATYLAFTTCP